MTRRLQIRSWLVNWHWMFLTIIDLSLRSAVTSPSSERNRGVSPWEVFTSIALVRLAGFMTSWKGTIVDPRSLYGYYISRSNVITALALCQRLGCIGNVRVITFPLVKKTTNPLYLSFPSISCVSKKSHTGPCHMNPCGAACSCYYIPRGILLHWIIL